MKSDENELRSWLTQHVAHELSLDEQDVPVDEPLANLGFSSRQAVALTGALEDHIGAPVDPAEAWEHPTIRSLAAHLATSR
jgi:phthiocerol/phenolphthiocerol synthesis type-I polyketide synthase D